MIFSDLLHAVCYCSHIMTPGTNGLLKINYNYQWNHYLLHANERKKNIYDLSDDKHNSL